MSDSSRPTPDAPDRALDRRKFITVAGIGAGLLLTGACGPGEEVVPGVFEKKRLPLIGRSNANVVVIGAGAFGGWTAYHLRRAGANVTMVDIWGPGNGRSTSGDESRGVRSSYGDREGGELWMLWAREAMKRWKMWDAEWSKDMNVNLYHTTGDVIVRADWDNLTTKTKDLWVKNKINHEVITAAEVKKRWPVFKVDDMTIAITEPDAGVIRARRATQVVAAAFEKLGGTIKIGKATITKMSNGKVDEVTLDGGEKLTADVFVFACGPWLGKVFPELLGNKIRAPMGYVSYFATPPGDERFTYPNLPSWNFPGVTGWAALPADNRGFRVRGGPRNPNAAGGRGGAAGGRAGNAAGARGAAGRGGPGGRGTGGGRNGRGGAVAGGGGGRGGQNRNQAPVDPRQLDPDLSDRWPDAARLEGPRNVLIQRFPDLKDAPLNATHSCHYEISSSGNFIVDKHPQLANVWIAGGGNAEGFKFGPVIGDYVAQRVLGEAGDPAVAKAFTIPAKPFEAQQATPAPMAADTTKKAATKTTKK
jgi:sarcosine oxidase